MTNTALTTPAAKSRPKQVTARLKTAIDLMTWSGKACNEAAAASGLTTRALRMALEKPHVLAYMRSQRRALLASEQPRTIVRLAELRDQNENRNAAVAASRTILFLPDDEPGAVGTGVPRMPGIVVQIVTNAPTDASRHPTITVTPTDADR